MQQSQDGSSWPRIATRAHEGQYDKVGQSYIEPPATVAALVQELPEFADLDEETRSDVVVAAWLHDTVPYRVQWRL